MNITITRAARRQRVLETTERDTASDNRLTQEWVSGYNGYACDRPSLRVRNRFRLLGNDDVGATVGSSKRRKSVKGPRTVK